MKASQIKGETVGGKRTILADVIPLETPFIVQIFPVYSCNFRCNYCIHSVTTDERKFIANEKFLDFELYKKCIDDLKTFPQKIKMLRFAGTGEPLLHPQIAEMVKYAKEKDAANSIEIVTNGALLTQNLSKKLVDAGLNWLRVSLQGVNAQKYKSISSANIDFEKFTSNLAYFYENKKNTNIYIKIIDAALDEGDEEKFYEIFGDICDKIAIESLIPAVPAIDYSQINTKKLENTQNGNKVDTSIEVCPQPFYMMQLNPDGNIIPCCAMETPFVSGNIKDQSLPEIWNGLQLKNFQIMQLKKEKSQNKICAECQTYKYGIFKEDILDYKAEEILEKY